jgi:Ni,Fe-hydrogenase I small subunit
VGLRQKLARFGLEGQADALIPRFNVLWLQSGGCGGCSMSLLCADTADFACLLRQVGVNLLWHPALSLANGARGAATSCNDCLSGRTPAARAVHRGRGAARPRRQRALSTCWRAPHEPMMQWVERLSAVAHHVVAVGSCAAFGGITAGGSNPTDACGLQYEGDQAGGLLGASGAIRRACRWSMWRAAPPTPAGCWRRWLRWRWCPLQADAAGHPGPAARLCRPAGAPRLHAQRVLRIQGQRREAVGDLGCLMEHMGCKGTQAHADCNTRLWNGEGSCTRGGYACISCTEPGFEEPGHAFHETPKVAGIPIGLPTDMHKAWFVALASLSKSATPKRVKHNADADHLVVKSPADTRNKPEQVEIMK